MRLPRSAWCTALFGWLVSSAAAADLTAYTEEWPPYNFSDGGQIRGIATDLLRSACQAANLQCDIRMVPWARAYALAQNQPNVMAYTMARLAAREKEFLWVGPILPRSISVYGRPYLKKNIGQYQDLTGKRIGVIRNSAAMNDLLANGISSQDLHIVGRTTDLLNLFIHDRIDLIVDTELSIAWSMRENGIPSQNLVKLLKLDSSVFYYFALNLNSDPGLVSKLQQAVDTARHAGLIDKLLAAYTSEQQQAGD